MSSSSATVDTLENAPSTSTSSHSQLLSPSTPTHTPTPTPNHTNGNGSCTTRNTLEVPIPTTNGNEDTLFIGDLRKDINEDDLFTYFSTQLGYCVENVMIKRSKYDYVTSLGYGFITFVSPEEAKRCLDHYHKSQHLSPNSHSPTSHSPNSQHLNSQHHNSFILKNKKMRLAAAERNCKLLIHNLPERYTKLTELNALGNTYGNLLGNETRVIPNDYGSYTGFLHYELREDAEMAKSNLHGILMDKNVLHVEWCTSSNLFLESYAHNNNANPNANVNGNGSKDTGNMESNPTSNVPNTSNGIATESVGTGNGNGNGDGDSVGSVGTGSGGFKAYVNLPVISLYIRFSSRQEGDVSNDILRKIYSRFGNVTAVSLKSKSYDPHSGLYHGYAFIHYEMSASGRHSAYLAVLNLSSAIVEDIFLITQFSRNFQKAENHLFSPPPIPSMVQPHPPAEVQYVVPISSLGINPTSLGDMSRGESMLSYPPPHLPHHPPGVGMMISPCFPSPTSHFPTSYPPHLSNPTSLEGAYMTMNMGMGMDASPHYFYYPNGTNWHL